MLIGKGGGGNVAKKSEWVRENFKNILVLVIMVLIVIVFVLVLPNIEMRPQLAPDESYEKCLENKTYYVAYYKGRKMVEFSLRENQTPDNVVPDFYTIKSFTECTKKLQCEKEIVYDEKPLYKECYYKTGEIGTYYVEAYPLNYSCPLNPKGDGICYITELYTSEACSEIYDLDHEDIFERYSEIEVEFCTDELGRRYEFVDGELVKKCVNKTHPSVVSELIEFCFIIIKEPEKRCWNETFCYVSGTWMGEKVNISVPFGLEECNKILTDLYEKLPNEPSFSDEYVTFTIMEKEICEER